MPRKKLLAFMLIAAMASTAMPVGAFADTVTGDIREITEADLDENNQKDISIPVQYTVGATFTVKLPSAITLSNTDGSWDYSGTVGVKGDIDAGKAVKVKPDSSITLYDVTNRPTDDVPSNADDQTYDHKAAKDATVVQAKTQWTMTELSTDTYKDTDLVLTAGSMQSGKWRGTLPVNITYGETGTEPGLYADDSTMTKSWGLIKSEGIVHVSNGGELTTDYNVDTDTNASSDALDGSLVLDDEVTSLGNDALNNCDSLTSVTIPETVTSIGGNALKGCDSLTEVSYEGTRDQWESVSKGDGWSDGTSVSTVTCSDGDAMIATTETAGLYGSNGSFTPWSTLVSDGKIKVTDNVIKSGSDMSMEGKLIIADGITSLGSRAFALCRKLTNINIPESVTSIGVYAFDECSNLAGITIPDGVTSIGEYAFDYCSGLTSITIPGSVISIGGHAFASCTGLTDITIQDGVTSIGINEFYNCTGLTRITIPDSVTSIGSDAFNGCSNLTSITIPDGVTSIENAAFWNCAGLTSITIPKSVKSIGENAFYGCSNLTSVSIPESATSIGFSAFYGCSKLTNINIPESVTSIGSCAFEDCTRLTSITIPNSVTSIGGCAFGGCRSLTSITIPDSVTSIENKAFYECSNLTSINIPESVTRIESRAFYACSNLADITFAGTQKQWRAITKKIEWKYGIPATGVHCSDGDVTL